MKHLLTVLCLIPLLGSASTAWAHAEEPNAQTLFGTPGGWVLRANFGAVESGDPNRLVCEEAYLGGEGWLLAVLGQTEWVTMGESTIQRTMDGCDFERVRDVPTKPTDAASDQESGNVAFVLNHEVDAGLWLSTDRGASFEQVDGLDADMNQMTGVRFLDANTVIVTGYGLGQSGAPVMWSVDVNTKTPTALNLPADTTYPYVLAAGGGQVVMLARRDSQMLFWGPPDDLDAVEYELTSWPTGASLSTAGDTVWVSGPESGKGILVGVRDGTDVTWETHAADLVANCVERFEETTYICSLNRLHDFDLFELAADGTTTGVVSFLDFAGARECPAATEVGDVCGLVWKQIGSYFGVDTGYVPDMGNGDPIDAGMAMDTGQAPGPHGGDGAAPQGPQRDTGCCTTVGSKNKRGGAWLLPVMILGLMWTRRVRSRGAA